MKIKISLAWCFLFFLCLPSIAQNAWIKGKIIDEKGKSIIGANIFIQKTSIGIHSDAKGEFLLKIPASQQIQVVISHLEHQQQLLSFFLQPDETKDITIRMKEGLQKLEGIEITSQKENVYENTAREQASTIKLDPKSLSIVPTGMGDFNQALISVGMGISSNSELSSSYSVRGGSFDENLVYVNGIEIYRPFLVRAGQQEGLSFVNSDLVDNIEFSSGGWQAQYGDKLSSVLNIQYRKPTITKASASVGLMGVTLHGEGKKGRMTVLGGLRHRDGRYFFRALEVKGSYFPVFTDLQLLSTLDLTPKNKEDRPAELTVFVSTARNRYLVIPQSSQNTFGSIQQKRIYVDYTGRESMNYDTYQAGLSLSKRFSVRLKSTLTLSGVNTSEREYIDKEGAYRLCDVETNTTSDAFNDCILVRSVASEYQNARNSLKAQIFSLQQRNIFSLAENHKFEFGFQINHEAIQDTIYEYKFLDSADFVKMTGFLESKINISSQRYTAYFQNTSYFGENQTLHYGVRLNYWSMNGQLLISPRIQYSIKPYWKKDIRFNAAVGIYQQPAFYREMRDFEGKINKNLKAQGSLHIIAGMDWNFEMFKRPFKFISELYYKNLWNVIPYDVDNVRLRYYATNDAKAYIWGADFRLSGEFIKGTESWFSLNILNAKENVGFDNKGYIRRPTDQRVTATIFFQDHLPNNPTFQVNMRLLFGTGLPFGVPNFVDSRAILNGSPYRRVDIGFSKHYAFEENKRIESLSLNLEVLNVLGAENIISYNWVEDFINNTRIAIPNGLSQRFLNFRVMLKY